MALHARGRVCWHDKLLIVMRFVFSRFLIEAPYSALAGVVADARDPPKVKFSKQ